jgi:O-antigen/teichoic acid export membrane protein
MLLKRSRALASDTLTFAIGTLSARGLQFLFLPVITRWYSAAVIGFVEMVVAAAALLLPLLTMNLHEAAFRLPADSASPEYKTSVLSSTFAWLVGIAVLGFFVLSGLSLATTVIGVPAFVIGLVVAQGLYQIVSVYSRGIGRTRAFAVGEILNALAFLAVIGIMILLGKRSASGYLAAKYAGFFIATLWFFLSVPPVRDIHIRRVDWAVLKEALSYSAPLVPNGLCWWMINSSDRLILGILAGAADTGIYSIAYRFPTILVMVSMVFQRAWQLTSIKQRKVQDRLSYERRIFEYFIAVLALLSVTLYVLAVVAYPYLIGPAFQDGLRVVGVLLIAVLFLGVAQFVGVAYVVEKDTLPAMVTSLVAAAANLVLNVLLIPIWGMLGAAVATAGALFMLAVIRTFHTQKYLRISVPWVRLVIVSMLVVMGLGGSALVKGWPWPALVGLFLLMVLNRRELRSIARVVVP